MLEYKLEVFPLPEGIITETPLIGMRDGIKLGVSIYRPDKPGKFPVIMSFSPYAVRNTPDKYDKTLKMRFETGISIGRLRVSQSTPFEAPDPAFWVPNGYVVIHVDVRGYGRSEGEKKGSLRAWSKEEIQDYYEMIEWAGKPEWSNGNVGLNGVSYLAMSQYYAASTQPPHLKAIIPWEGASDQYRDTCFPGGIPENNFHVFWYSGNLGITLDESSLAALLDPVASQSILKAAPQLEKIKVPALICATWSDQELHTRGGFQAFRRISSKDRWLFNHGRRKWDVYYSDEGLRYQKKFFDYFLKGIENGMRDTLRVRLEIRENQDEYKVRYENEWPLARTEYKKLYLDAKAGSLSFDKVNQKGKVSYDSEGGKAVFDIRLGEDTELTGYMKLKLWVSAEEADDMDLFIGVEKLDAKGNEVYFYSANGYVKGVVARGWLRASQRELDKKLSTEWQPYLKHQGEKKLQPGEIVAVEIPILPSGTLFRKGETLRLAIYGKDAIAHPTFTYTRLINKGAHSLCTGGEYDSHLLIPVIPR